MATFQVLEYDHKGNLKGEPKNIVSKDVRVNLDGQTEVSIVPSSNKIFIRVGDEPVKKRDLPTNIDEQRIMCTGTGIGLFFRQAFELSPKVVVTRIK